MKRFLTALFLALAGLNAQAESFRFALIGDVPYTPAERRALPALLDEIGRSAPAFIVHAGDIKSGAEPCTDELYMDRLAVFEAAPAPLVFVFGDNEWTDCGRILAGAYDPNERLMRLRQIFHTRDTALGPGELRLERQSADPRFPAFREHVRWRQGPVLFVALNVPGSDNGRGAIPGPEYLERTRAVEAWIESSFRVAREQRLRGIVLMAQGNPFVAFAGRNRVRAGYRELVEQLTRETLGFSGQVMLVHGDTHMQRIDRPLRHPRTGHTIERFVRVETHGSPWMGWTEVVVDTGNPLLFRMLPHHWGQRHPEH